MLTALPTTTTIESHDEQQPLQQNSSSIRHQHHHQQQQQWNRLSRAARITMMLVVLVGMPMILVYWQEEPITQSETIKEPTTTSQSRSSKAKAAVKESKLGPYSITTTTTTSSSLVQDNLNLTIQTDADETDDEMPETKSSLKQVDIRENAAKKGKEEKTPDYDPKKGKQTQNIEKNKQSHTLPSMVWLMSFPNSGTSYTMRMVATASNRAVATNYGAEMTNPPYPNTPLYNYNSNTKKDDGDDTAATSFQGPFWDAQGENDLPDEYIITKTHCGSRCGRCSPRRYIMTPEQFTRACAQGMGCATPKKTGNATAQTCEWIEYEYPSPPQNPHLAKLIHLIRNPFDNIVSRYHLALKNARKRVEDGTESNEWLEQHPNTATGFEKWCQELDDKYGSPLVATKHNTNATLNCLGEFYKWTQWHTLALETIRTSGLPTLTVYYEEYEQDWNATVHKILDFLHVSEVSDQIRSFVPGKHYDEYYTDRQRTEARSLVQQVASPEAWKLLKRYF